MKIIIWDIETSPLLVTSWGIFKPYLTHDNIERNGNILTATWKVVGEKKVHAVSVKSTSPTDDKELVQVLCAALSEADVIVAHNGDAFDRAWLNARIAFHNLQPLPPIRSVDTLKVARTQFRFTSNRLDYLGKYLGLGEKIHTSYSLWKDVLAGDERALARMVRYNVQDVLLLEKIYLRLRPFMLHHPNQSLVNETTGTCPVCGSGHVHKKGVRILATTTRQRYQCQNPECGAWSYGAKMISRAEVGN